MRQNIGAGEAAKGCRIYCRTPTPLSLVSSLILRGDAMESVVKQKKTLKKAMESSSEKLKTSDCKLERPVSTSGPSFGHFWLFRPLTRHKRSKDSTKTVQTLKKQKGYTLTHAHTATSSPTPIAHHLTSPLVFDFAAAPPRAGSSGVQSWSKRSMGVDAGGTMPRVHQGSQMKALCGICVNLPPPP